MNRYTWADIAREEEGHTTVANCADCNRSFVVTGDAERFCGRCNALFEIEAEEGEDI